MVAEERLFDQLPNSNLISPWASLQRVSSTLPAEPSKIAHAPGGLGCNARHADIRRLRTICGYRDPACYQTARMLSRNSGAAWCRAKRSSLLLCLDGHSPGLGRVRCVESEDCYLVVERARYKTSAPERIGWVSPEFSSFFLPVYFADLRSIVGEYFSKVWVKTFASSGTDTAPLRIWPNGTDLPYRSLVESSSGFTATPLRLTPANAPRARE